MSEGVKKEYPEERERREILDDLAISLLRAGEVDLALALEEYDDLRSDIRWEKISSCLREVGVSKKFAIFCQENPDWEAARQTLA